MEFWQLEGYFFQILACFMEFRRLGGNFFQILACFMEFRGSGGSTAAGIKVAPAAKVKALRGARRRALLAPDFCGA